MNQLGLAVDSQKRANKFTREAFETKLVYYLKQGQSPEVSETTNYEDKEGNALPIIPFWSKTYIPYARKWSDNSEIQQLSLEDFTEYWLTGMQEDEIMVGLNWDQNGIGHECTPLDLLEELEKMGVKGLSA